MYKDNNRSQVLYIQKYFIDEFKLQRNQGFLTNILRLWSTGSHQKKDGQRPTWMAQCRPGRKEEEEERSSEIITTAS